MAPALALLSLAGCAGAGLGTVGDVLGNVGGLGGEVRGEVERVDTRQRELRVRSGIRGSTRLSYDSRTEVVYRNSRYPVSALERGDLVTVQVERDRRGDAYARRIRVEETRGLAGGRDRDRDDRDRDDRARNRRVERFDGRVGWVEPQRGRFELRSSRASYTVTIPYTPSNATRERLRRLRTGQSVRIEGEMLGNARIELVRFL